MKRLLGLVSLLVSFGAYAAAIGVVPVQGAPNGTAINTIVPDTTSAATVLNAACSSGSSCAAGSVVVLPLAGINNVSVTFSAPSSPLMTLVADCSLDGNVSYQLSVVRFKTSSGTVSTTVVNPSAGGYALINVCPGASHVRIRVGSLTSGSVTAQLRGALSSQIESVIGAPDTMNAAPAQALAVMAHDMFVPSTTRSLAADSSNNLAVTLRNGSTSTPAMASTSTYGYQRLTDGSNSITVRAGSSAAASTDASLVVSQNSANSSVTSVQGSANTIANGWPVKVTDGTNTMPTMDAAARAGFHKVTDGTNTMPTMDVAARAGFQKVTDGTNTMPTMDATARAGFHKITDGTNVAAVKAASTVPASTDPALVVSLNPFGNAVSIGPGTQSIGNVTLNAGTSTIGAAKLTDGTNVATVKAASTPATATDTALVVSQNSANSSVASVQGSANTLANAWPVKVSDGTNTMPTMDTVFRAGYQTITDGTNTMPTMDAAARAGFHKITDGTNVAAVKAASTTPAATDPAMVVSMSPNSNSLAVTGTVSVAAGAQVYITDGTRTAGIKASSTSPTVSDQALVVTVSPNTPTLNVQGTVALGTGSNTIGSAKITDGTSTAAVKASGATVSSLDAAVVTAISPNSNTVVLGAGTAAVGSMALINGTNAAAVKGGSTAPVVGDNALVVSISPNSVDNQGSPATLANGWPVKVTDGTNTMPTMDAAARAGFHKITDGTSTASVKAASTATAATDLALVVDQRAPVGLFTCRATSITASTTTSCQAAPGSNSLYITDWVVSDTAGTAAGTVKLVTGTGGTCTTPSDLTIPLTVNKTNQAMSYRTPIKVTAVQAICVTSVLGTANSFNVEVHGYTAP